MLAEVQQFDYFAWVVIPLLIFFSRIVDVTIGTARVIFVSRGYKAMAAVSGFFEVLIWLIAIGQIMQRLDNPVCYLAYASGFALGNYIGIRLTEKMSLGTALVQVMTNRDPSNLIEALKSSEYRVTTVQAQGAFQPVKLVFTIVPRRELDAVLKIVKTHNPQSQYTIQDIGSVKEGFFPQRRKIDGLKNMFILRPYRKGK